MIKILLGFILFSINCMSESREVSSKVLMDKIYRTLDVTSFRSSIRPRIGGDKRKITLSEIKNLPSPKITNKFIFIENDRWKYKFEFTEEDNGDYTILFTDKSKQGTYNTESFLLIREYGDYFVAIDNSSID